MIVAAAAERWVSAMIMPIDIDKKEFSRVKKGYNSREVDEFLDLIIVDYEKVLNDNRNMAHKIKYLEKQLEESQKTDTAMLDTLETAKRLMADISASAERRAELMMRDAQLESENMVLEAKNTVRKMNDEHLMLKHKVERLRDNFRRMLETELEKIKGDDYDLLPDIDRSDLPDIEREMGGSEISEQADDSHRDTLVIKKKADHKDTLAVDIKDDVETAQANEPAEEVDLSDNLKALAEDKQEIDDTIILK